MKQRNRTWTTQERGMLAGIFKFFLFSSFYGIKWTRRAGSQRQTGPAEAVHNVRILFCHSSHIPSQDTSHNFVLDQAPQLLTHPSQTLSSQLHSKLNQTKTETGRCCESIFCIEEMSDWIQQNVSANVGWSLILLVFIPRVTVYEASYWTLFEKWASWLPGSQLEH